MVAGVAVLALGGAGVAALSMGGGGGAAPATPPPAGPAALGDAVPTSFGFVSADTVERVKGVGARQLAGMTHGINNLVPAGSTQLQVGVTITNARSAEHAYTPAWFAIETAGRRTPVRPTAGSIRAGVLQPDAAIEGSLVFVVPARGQRAVLVVDDPAGAPVRIDLGRVDRAAAPAHQGHVPGARP
jgi:hypothetical protein